MLYEVNGSYITIEQELKIMSDYIVLENVFKLVFRGPAISHLPVSISYWTNLCLQPLLKLIS